MTKPTQTQREFLEEIAFENPEPEEKWMVRDHWDPPFPLATIDAVARKGWIETRGDRRSDNYGFRFTQLGRQALKDSADEQ